MIDALDGEMEYTYHPFGELATVEDDDDNVTWIDYDARGHKSEMSDPDMGGWASETWTYDYNIYGELEAQTDALGQSVTLDYDAAGRLDERTEHEGTTDWEYYDDTADPGQIGRLDTVTSPGYSEHYDYSSANGAPTLIERVIDSTTYAFDYSYDSEGRLDVMTYPESTTGFRFAVNYDYDAYGELSLVKNDATPSLVYYELEETDALGRERDVTLGNGLSEVRDYDEANGYLASILTGSAGAVQDLSYEWDEVGNLTKRTDDSSGKAEEFWYDELNRLEDVDLNSSPLVSLEYDALGNIEYKSDYGTYTYGSGTGGPHALTDVSGTVTRAYDYDENGNMIEWQGDPITWYSFNKPKKIEYGSDYSELWYGADRQRIKQVAFTGASGGTLHYVGDQFEILIAGPLEAYAHHVFANGRAVARYTSYNFQGPDLRYMHRDHLGSVVATTSDTGTVLSRYEFDAFGVRDQTYGSGLWTQKGFTGHEHLDAVDLIDMRGRVQDPFSGRFLSPDPFVQAPYSSQSHNRYSYAWNNPTSFVDPSGFAKFCTYQRQTEAVHCSDWPNIAQPGGTPRATPPADRQGPGRPHRPPGDTTDGDNEDSWVPAGVDGEWMADDTGVTYFVPYTELGRTFQRQIHHADLVVGGVIAGAAATAATCAYVLLACVAAGELLELHGLADVGPGGLRRGVPNSAAGNFGRRSVGAAENPAGIISGNLKRLSDSRLKRLGIDAEAVKADIVPGQGSRFNLNVDQAGNVFLAPVRRGTADPIPAFGTLDDLARDFPIRR